MGVLHLLLTTKPEHLFTAGPHHQLLTKLRPTMMLSPGATEIRDWLPVFCTMEPVGVMGTSMLFVVKRTIPLATPMQHQPVIMLESISRRTFLRPQEPEAVIATGFSFVMQRFC